MKKIQTIPFKLYVLKNILIAIDVEFCRTILLDILWKILYIRNIIKQGQENDILFHIVFFNILFGQKNYFKNNCQKNN